MSFVGFQRSRLSACNGRQWKPSGCRGRRDVGGKRSSTPAAVVGGKLRQGGFWVSIIPSSHQAKYIPSKTASFWCRFFLKKKNNFNWTGRFRENQMIRPVHRLDYRFKWSDPGSNPSRSNWLDQIGTATDQIGQSGPVFKPLVIIDVMLYVTLRFLKLLFVDVFYVLLSREN